MDQQDISATQATLATLPFTLALYPFRYNVEYFFDKDKYICNIEYSPKSTRESQAYSI
jgi:hypothetical protein